MHTQIVPHTMTRAMQIIERIGTQMPPRQKIQLTSPRTLGKHRSRQIYVTFKHQGEIAPLLLRHLTHMDGARYVGCAAQIVPARINQQKTRRTHTLATLLRGTVMHNGTIGLVTHYWCEALAPVKRALGPQLSYLDPKLPFGGSPSGYYELLQPHVKTHQCHPVLYHGASETLYLGIVLDRFHGSNHTRTILLGLSQSTAQTQQVVMTPRQRGRIEHHTPAAALRQGIVKASVIVRYDTFTLQAVYHGHRQFVFIDKQCGLVGLHQQIGHHHRVIFDIAAAYIQKPGYLVKRRHYIDGIALQSESLAQTLQLG